MTTSLKIDLQLTQEQLGYINHHKIPMNALIDAKGKKIGELKRQMDKEDKYLAFNTASCSRSNNHTFKTKSGHCPECNTAAFAFIRRQFTPGFVYIAGSIKGRVIKIGLCDDISGRARTLNKKGSKYANWGDWEILAHIKVSKPGKVERLVQERLICYKEIVQYDKGEKIQIATETYRCSFNKAKDALQTVLKELGIVSTLTERAINPSQYNFRCLPRTVNL